MLALDMVSAELDVFMYSKIKLLQLQSVLSPMLSVSPHLIWCFPRSQWPAIQEEYVDQGGDGGRVPRTWVALGPRWHVCRDPTPHLERQPTAAHSTHKKRNTNYIKRYLCLLQLYSTKSICVWNSHCI